MTINYKWGPSSFTAQMPGASPLFGMTTLGLQIALMRLRFGLTEAQAQALAALIWRAVL